MNLNNIFPALGDEVPTVDNSAVGTVDNPRTAHPLEHIPTGRAARAAEGARFAAFSKATEEGKRDIALPLGSRARRRQIEADRRRQAKKMRRAFVNREWARERETSDLRQLFAVVDGQVPTRIPGDPRAYAAIDARVAHIQDRQFEAGQEIENHNAIVDRLRLLAATARPDMGRRSRIAADKLSQELQADDLLTGHPVVG